MPTNIPMFAGFGAAGTNPYKRGQQAYGFNPGLRRDFLSRFKSNAYNTGLGVTNQINQNIPARSAARLTGIQRGAAAGSEAFNSAALPFMQQEQQFAEGQRNADVGFGLQRTGQEADFLKFLMALKERRREFDKSNQFTFADLLGNLFGAGAQVGSAALVR
jgi:hypothetical protein